MEKRDKIIGISATILVLAGLTVGTVAQAGNLSMIKEKISSFVFGTKKDPQMTECLRRAFDDYRGSLKEGRDVFVSASADFRSGYKAAVAEASARLKQASRAGFIKSEDKNELKVTRKSALKEWSDRLHAARVSWQEAQKASIEGYRKAKSSCLAQQE